MAINKSTGSGVTAKKSEWIDISYPLSENMVFWPNDPISPRVDWIYHPKKNMPVIMAQLNINVHNGTHIDAPRHFNPTGTPIDKMPLDAIIGPARILEIKDKESVKTKEIEPYNIQPGERILFKTINSSYYKLGKFIEDFCYISTEAAEFLKNKKVSVVGLDYLAIGSFKDKENLVTVHNTLIGNGIWVIEAIDLSAVKSGQYEIICLPIRLTEGDGAPARAIVRPV